METSNIIPSLNEDSYVKDIYNKIGHHFDHTRGYSWSWIEEFKNKYCNPHSIVYDIGCGSGRNLIKSPTWIGIDNSETFINICREKGFNTLQADMTNIPLPDDSADRIMSIASFHHLYTVERRLQSLNEMKRLIKPNGKILLSVWSVVQPKKTRRTFKHGDTIVTWDKHGEIFERYYYIFKIDEIKELFHNVGLKIESHMWDCGNEVFILSK